MSETETIAKIVFVLGIVFLMIGLLNPGAAAAWDTFSTGIQDFPSFNNPFGARPWTFTPDSDGPVGLTTAPLNVRGDDATVPGYCDADEYPVDNDWRGCLVTQDTNLTYDTSGFGGFSEGIAVNLDDFPDSSGNWIIIDVTITFSCKSHGSGVSFEFYDGATTFLTISDAADETSCHIVGSLANDDFNESPGYLNDTLFDDTTVDDIRMTGTRGIGGSQIRIANGGAIGSDDLFTVTYLSVGVHYQRSASCLFEPSGNPWDDVSRATYYVGCVIGAIGLFFLDAVTFIINGLIFTGEIIFYLANFVFAFLALFGYLLSLPGAPPVIQGIFTLFVIGCLAMIILSLVTRIRGSGSVG